MESILNKKKNQLLVKDDVGKAKPATRDLPPDGFAFGKPDRKDPEGAGIGNTYWDSNSPLVTSSWRAHEQSKQAAPERDFKKLNKMGIKGGAVDAKVSLSSPKHGRNLKNSERTTMQECKLGQRKEWKTNL